MAAWSGLCGNVWGAAAALAPPPLPPPPLPAEQTENGLKNRSRNERVYENSTQAFEYVFYHHRPYLSTLLTCEGRAVLVPIVFVVVASIVRLISYGVVLHACYCSAKNIARGTLLSRNAVRHSLPPPSRPRLRYTHPCMVDAQRPENHVPLFVTMHALLLLLLL